MSFRVALLIGSIVMACAPPDPITVNAGPAIEVKFPEQGQTLTLNDNCEIETILVVDIDGLTLVDPEDDREPVDGEGHWHGGPSLERGFCRSAATWCDDYDRESFSDGSNVLLSVSLVTNNHLPLGPEAQVEVTLEAPDGVTCP
ncbi:MAG: hypothetical protein AAGA48_11690 [Myxococcota bacterium]